MKTLRIVAVSLIILISFASSVTAEVKVKSLCDVRFPSDARVNWPCRKIQWKDTPSALFGDRWRDVLRFNRMDRRHFIGGRSIKVPVNLDEIKNYTPLPQSYPPAAHDEKFILIDQSEMYLGAYEYGKLVLSFPVAVGIKGHRVPDGDFKIDAADRWHKSNLYTVEEIGKRYPMHYGLRFFVDKNTDGWPAFYIHGRDVPGYPASHGCVGLYDEEMQEEYYSAHDRKVNKPYYHELTKPYLEAAKAIYKWATDSHPDPGKFHKINGPRVLIVGIPPL